MDAIASRAPVAGVPLAPEQAQDPAPRAEEHDSPQSDAVEDDDLDVETDDAQSILQPAISPIATLLTSPRTPAAEKAAAFDRQLGDGLSDRLEGDEPGEEGQPEIVVSYDTSSAPVNLPGHASPVVRLPTPWQAGPKQFLIAEPGRFKSSMAAAFSTRPQRAQSVGDSALKRLSKALPSISIPSGLIPNIPTPTFFSSGSSSGSPPKDARTTQSRPPAALLTSEIPSNNSLSSVSASFVPPIQPDSARPRTLRHTASDDSLLYHTLSRVSSLGDDERFAHVREQVNSRFKAIKDSFDGPSFKLPQMPSMLFCVHALIRLTRG